MALRSRIAELMKRHEKLEKDITQVLAQPGSDDLHISELKRQKLRLKDEIDALKIEVERQSRAA